MPPILPHPHPPLTNTLLIISAMCAASAFYAVNSHAAPPLVGLCIVFAPIVAVGMWFRNYLRQARFDMPFDFGYFILMGWPILIPVFAKRAQVTHRWRFAAVLYTLAAAPVLVSMVVEIALLIVGRN